MGRRLEFFFHFPKTSHTAFGTRGETMQWLQPLLGSGRAQA